MPYYGRWLRCDGVVHDIFVMVLSNERNNEQLRPRNNLQHGMFRATDGVYDGDNIHEFRKGTCAGSG